ncbi:MAG: nuclear transport factor 2 family protein [Gammaproteobacteria bacterium]|nr:nuclear transport factor 2 family protein [Gammaproteobacteria bacterium]
MKKIIQLFIFLTFTSLLSNTFASDITKNDVMNLIDVIDKAISSQDAKKLANIFSDDVKMTMKVTMAGASETITASKQEYITMAKESWAVSDNYKYSRNNVKIDISGNVANVSADVNESMTMSAEGRSISIKSDSFETLTIEMINDVPLITKLKADSKMSMMPL